MGLGMGFFWGKGWEIWLNLSPPPNRFGIRWALENSDIEEFQK